MRRLRHLIASLTVLGAVLLVMPLVALAHEHRHILDEQYEVTVGFINEPAFAGEMNGLYVKFASVDGDEETGVVGLADALTAEVIFGDQSMPLELEPVWQDDGAYQGIFFPTTPGDYTFHIAGEIEGEAFDETFTSSPEGFDSVQDPAPLQFPKAS